ncbi:MAG: hypothetical protein ABR582_07245 [Gemmatimonadaceae bacterium]
MRRYAAVFFGLLLFGCSSDNSVSADIDAAAGVYVLQTVDGKPLPFDAGNQGGAEVVIVKDQYTLTSGRTYTRDGTLRLSEFGITTTQSVTENGSWNLNGGTLTLTISSSSLGQTGNYSGSLAGSSLSINEMGFLGVYKKS